MPLLWCPVCAPWEVTALDLDRSLGVLPWTLQKLAGVREEVPVVRERWMGAGGLRELSGCVRWVRGGREEGVPVLGCASTAQGGGTGQD